MQRDYPDKPAGLHPSLKARQGFINMHANGGHIGNISWAHGDPAGGELGVPFFGKTGWSPSGWPILGYTDDVAWVAQAAVRRARYLQMEK